MRRTLIAHTRHALQPHHADARQQPMQSYAGSCACQLQHPAPPSSHGIDGLYATRGELRRTKTDRQRSMLG